MCTVAINVLEPGAFHPESQHFIPRFNKNFTTLRDEASNEGCNSGPTRHDFKDNSILLFKMESTKVIDYSSVGICWSCRGTMVGSST
jgi:hypothetical protein